MRTNFFGEPIETFTIEIPVTITREGHGVPGNSEKTIIETSVKLYIDAVDFTDAARIITNRLNGFSDY